MTRFLRVGAALALLLALPASAPAQAAAQNLAVRWPQATSDIKADPNVRFGLLPNGMR